MGLKFGFRGSLLRCGRCGQRYSNPLSHVCVTSRRQARPTRLQPRASITVGKCGACGKPVSNPLTHTCSGGGDFTARRRAQARAEAKARRKGRADARRQRERERVASVRRREREKADVRVARAKAGRRKGRAARPGQGHDYRRCSDSDCTRPACLAYAEGVAEGLEIGRAEGQEMAMTTTGE